MACVLCLSLASACERHESEGSAARNGTNAGAMSQRAFDEAASAIDQYLTMGRPGEALVIARKLSAADPQSAPARELLARSLLAAVILEGESGPNGVTSASAADAYRDAAALDPSNAGLQHAAGVALDRAGRLELALTHYERARSRELSNPQFALYTAMTLRRLGRLDEALRMIDAASALAPDEAIIEVVRSDALLAKGDAAASLVAAQRARMLAPADMSARLAEARALRRSGRPAQAAESLGALPEASLADEAVAQELADSLLDLGRSEAAARAWERSLDVDPRRWRSAVGAAEAWLTAGDIIRAQARLQQAREMAPREPRVAEAQTKFDHAARVSSAPAPQ